MQLFTEIFLKNKCIALHDFCYEFLVVFGQVRVWDRKGVGRARVGMAGGAGAG